MTDSPRPLNVRDLDRINLRLAAETFEAIDLARTARPGHVSRNTWLSEAVAEKLARDATPGQATAGERRHG
jgi:hypothetical protein